MPKPYIYKMGERVGNYGIIFIKEVSPYISPQNKKIRRAVFQCGLCGNFFITNISNVKHGLTSRFINRDTFLRFYRKREVPL